MTVQVRDPDTLGVRGTGVLVSPSGQVVTCAHVIRDCGVDPYDMDGTVMVHIPATTEHDAEDREARISWFPEGSEDDLVLLKLTGGPVAPERVGRFGPADVSAEHPFRSFGFRRRDEYLGLHAKGSIEGHVPSPRHFLVEPVQLESRDLDSGMSGAAVFDVERNLVIGFVFQVWEPGQSAKDRDLAFAVDAAVLGSSPVGGLLVLAALEPEPLAGPELDRAIGEVISGPAENAAPIGWAMQTAPDNLGVFVGREQELGFIEQLWRARQTRVIGLSGFAGQGKTSLVRTWLEGHRQVAGPAQPQSVLWWTFDASFNDVDDFLTAVVGHVSDGRIDPAALPAGIAKANLAAALLQSSRRHVIVLDGLDALQAARGDLAGSLTSPALKDFLDYVAAGKHQSLCILTGTLDFQDFEHIATFRGLRIGPLPAAGGRALLRANGVHGTDQMLDGLVTDWEGHALALTAIAVYLTAEGGGQARRLAELPSRDPGLPFAERLRAVGTMIERQRTPIERTALIILALARLPLAVTALAEIIRRTGAYDGVFDIGAELSALADSDAIRTAANGDLLLHPVLRSLYRAETYEADARPARDFHRLLAEYYYQAATEARNRAGRA